MLDSHEAERGECVAADSLEGQTRDQTLDPATLQALRSLAPRERRASLAPLAITALLLAVMGFIACAPKGAACRTRIETATTAARVGSVATWRSVKGPDSVESAPRVDDAPGPKARELSRL